MSGVLELFAEQVARTPDAEAVVLGQERMTYRELDRRSDRLARYLHGRGAGPDEVVGLYLERSAGMITALLAVLKSGAAYLPLDPGLPAERLARIVERAAPRLVLTQRSLAGLLPAGTATVTEDDDAAVAACPAQAPDTGLHPHNLAYVIFTSGSTGTPKGIMIDHRALGDRAAAKTELYGFGPGDRVLQFTSLAFDAAAAEIYPALLSGATLVVHPRPQWTSPRELLDDCRRLGISSVMLPPVFLQLLVEELEASGERIPWLRHFVTGGESIPVGRLAAWARLNPHRPHFVYAYGPTETTVAATLYLPPMDPDLIGRLERVPIGSPLPGTGVHVLDDALRPVPAGEVGELWITGTGLARGYLGQPALTAESFVPSPFGPPGSRMYRTGDLARQTAGGALEFAGRVDDQVKIRGYRIDPGDIAAALALHPELGPSVVVPYDGRLAAYCVPRGGVRPGARELREFLAAKLPEYMVPSHFVVLDALPLMPGGKVDLKALPDPQEALPDPAPGAAPVSPVEQLLAEIWCELLRRDSVGTDEDFFAAGGDSLLANQVVARVRDTLGIAVPLQTVFRAPTLGGLAAEVTEAAAADTAAAEMLALLSDIGSMSDEEAGRLLGGEAGR